MNVNSFINDVRFLAGETASAGCLRRICNWALVCPWILFALAAVSLGQEVESVIRGGLPEETAKTAIRIGLPAVPAIQGTGRPIALQPNIQETQTFNPAIGRQWSSGMMEGGSTAGSVTRSDWSVVKHALSDSLPGAAIDAPTGPPPKIGLGRHTLLDGVGSPILSEAIAQHRQKRQARNPGGQFIPLNVFLHPFDCNCQDSILQGLGHERVQHAMFEIDTAEPYANRRFRVVSAYDQTFADRAAFFWSAAPIGPPAIERNVNYFDYRFSFEVGGPAFSTRTEIPIRVVDPTVNGNHAGLGDLEITTKTRLINGKNWMVTQYLRVYTPTADANAGLGTGHVSMEPGVLIRLKWGEFAYWHSELKYWIPLGANPLNGGQVLRYGLGFSNVLYESDLTTVMLANEIVGWSVLDGSKSSMATGVLPVDGESIFNYVTGVKWALDSDGDFGITEIGVSSGFALTRSRWSSALIRFDLSFSF